MQRINFRGLNIRIEQQVGSVREGVGKNGNRWKVRFYRPYGFISDTMGKMVKILTASSVITGNQTMFTSFIN